MADTSETGTHAEGTSNGVSSSSSYEADRAAFIAGIGGDAPGPKGGTADKAVAKPAASDDTDSDLDEDEESPTDEESGDEDLDEDDSKVAAGEDDDSDLEEDEDEDEEKPDADTAKRLEQVKRTDKRLREQREKHFQAREAEIQRTIQKTIDEWGPRIEKAEKTEALIARLRNPYEIGEVLRELGMPDDDEYIVPASQAIFQRSKKFADDPKAKETVAKLKSDRELREEVANLKKREAERVAAEEKRQAEAAAERDMRALIESSATLKLDKTPLAAQFIAKNPDRARREMAAITARLIEEKGEMPTPKAVRIQLEKDRRQFFRDQGIDPRTQISAAAVSADKSKPALKKTDAKTGKQIAGSAKVDDKKPLTKEDFINGKYD